MHAADAVAQHPATTRTRALAAVALAAAVLVFTRVRGEIAPYVAIHRWLDDAGVPAWLRNLDNSLLLVVVSVLAARIAFGRGNTLHGLGLRAPFARAAIFSLVAAAPMIGQGALQCVLTNGTPRFDLGTARGVLVAPLVEELLFRAVFVAIPVRCARLPFWPTAIIAGLVFGSVHVRWTSVWHAGHVAVFAVTTVGGIWYAWLLRCFAWNLWTTILLHAAMNAAWMVFAVSSDAAGGLWPNVGRGLTIAVATALAIASTRRSG